MESSRLPLDVYDDRPREMRAYLKHNGWHFTKKAYEYASSLMKRQNPATGKLERIEPYSKDQVDEMLTRYGVVVENNVAYDYVYVASMCKADFLKSSIADENHLALYVKDVIDDADAGDGTVMRRWYAGMTAAGTPVDWSEIV